MTRQKRPHGAALALLLCSGACSLRSLDYLHDGELGASAGSTAKGGAETSGNGGSLGGGTDGGGKAGTGGTEGGSGNVSSNGGTAGSIPVSGGTSGAGGSGGVGGSVDPSGGNDTGGNDMGGSDGGGTGGEDGSAGEAGAPSCTAGDPGCPPAVVPEIPYVLRPGHALSKCVDLQNFSVINGGAAIQYSCYHQLNQIFWAEDHGDGLLSFRNALSGKCLDVSGASLNPDALVHQWTCAATPNQLFLPVDAGGGIVRLVAQHSEMVIDVIGAAPTDNVRQIVQNANDGSPDMTWELERSEFAFVTLAANEHPDLILRHDGEEVLMETSTEGSSEWKVVRGLGDWDCVSFSSRDDPERYLRQSALSLYREADDGSSTFATDATFCFRLPLEGTGYTTYSLESVSQPGHYVKRDGESVVLEETDGTVEFRTAATWSFGQLR